jgi:uncharacterized lipoprotein YbaY
MPSRHPSARKLAAAAVLALALASCKAPPEIAGRVVPRGKVALPADAVLEIQVADVTRRDEAPLVLARRTYTPLGEAPWRFTLRADSLRGLDSTHVYSLQARVLVGGKPQLVSKRRTVLNPARLADTLEVVVEPVPRTVGARIGGPGGRPAGLWNPPGRPVTLPAPNPPLVARLAADPAPDRACGTHSQTESPACPPSPAH